MAMKPISTKGLTKDLIDKFSILTGAKYFSLGIFQNYFVFLLILKFIHGNLMECQEKVLKT